MGQVAVKFGLRLFQALAVALAVSTLCFVLLVSLPGDLALQVALARYGEDQLNEKAVALVRQEAGLDAPLAARYLGWLKQTLALDLGRSLVTGRPVAEEIAWHLGFTLKLALAGLGLSLVLAVPWGLLCGLRPGSALDGLGAAISGALVSLPSFVLGVGLILVLAIELKVLPAAGFSRPVHLVLPALTLALGLAAVSSRVIRTAVAEVRGSFYLTFARLKGLPGRRVFLGHFLKNASIPVITFLGLQLAHLLDGVVVVENLFNYPGLGRMLLEAILDRDLPLLQGGALVVGLGYVAVNALVDLVCLRLDPRQGDGEARP